MTLLRPAEKLPVGTGKARPGNSLPQLRQRNYRKIKKQGWNLIQTLLGN
jgi:hypothetical protein